MLQLATDQYLKSIGDKYFVPSPDYLEWAAVTCLDIAIKRKPKWIWQKNKYFFDHMNINDLIDSPLTGDMSIHLKKPEPITPDFSWSSSHDIKSKAGGEIASLVSFDVSTNDIVTVSIDMSGMEKLSIDFHAVTEMLKNKKINVNSNYIRNISNNKNNVICLVTQYLYLTTKTEMKISMNRDVSEKSSGADSTKITVNDSGNFQFSKTKSLVFDVGTRLAFDFLELMIHPDGSFELLDRSEKSSKLVMIPNFSKISKDVYIENDYLMKNIYLTDADKIGHDTMPSHKSSQLLENEEVYIITRYLLAIAIDDKTVLKQLESFLQASSDSNMVDLSVFKDSRDANLVELLKCIGVDTDTASTSHIPCITLNHDLVRLVLEKIEAIVYLEDPNLQNLLNIIDEGNSELMKLLIEYLQNLKQEKVPDNSVLDGGQNRDRHNNI